MSLERFVIPDEPAVLKHHLIRLADSRQVDLVITEWRNRIFHAGTRHRRQHWPWQTGMRLVLPSTSRMKSMQITDRAMLSRGASVIRKRPDRESAGKSEGREGRALALFWERWIMG